MSFEPFVLCRIKSTISMSSSVFGWKIDRLTLTIDGSNECEYLPLTNNITFPLNLNDCTQNKQKANTNLRFTLLLLNSTVATFQRKPSFSQWLISWETGSLGLPVSKTAPITYALNFNRCFSVIIKRITGNSKHPVSVVWYHKDNFCLKTYIQSHQANARFTFKYVVTIVYVYSLLHFDCPPSWWWQPRFLY